MSLIGWASVKPTAPCGYMTHTAGVYGCLGLFRSPDDTYQLCEYELMTIIMMNDDGDSYDDDDYDDGVVRQ